MFLPTKEQIQGEVVEAVETFAVAITNFVGEWDGSIDSALEYIEAETAELNRFLGGMRALQQAVSQAVGE